MGYGVIKVWDKVIVLVEYFGVLIMIIFKGKGFILDNYLNVVGVFGWLGILIVSWLMNEVDFILLLGFFFVNYIGIVFYKLIIQVDFECMQFGKFYFVILLVWGEIGVFCDVIYLMVEKLFDVV